MQLDLFDDGLHKDGLRKEDNFDVSHRQALDLESLNSGQRAAVVATEGPLLVLAGAGSGKTRVLTYRIAHIVENLGVSVYQILAITFTNKAAAEMRERLGALLNRGIRGMWVATFHAMCVRMLRQDATVLNYTRNFTIYDDDDSKRLVKSIFADLNIDVKQFPINGVRDKISKAKNELITALQYEAMAANGFERLVARVYTTLQDRLKAMDAMDFDDLLVNTWLLLSKNPEILKAYQNRFCYIHIDEYQDTNHAQYAIAQLLAKAHHNIMVVGDDDQSIYSWRGANIRNILEFEHDYPSAKVIKLEQNYRSTKTILAAANSVIANNSQRKSKKLFTEGEKGAKIALYQASDERDEGRWIASETERLHRSGRKYRDFAVFYRTNAQSRVLEDMLLRAGIPYRIVGGTRFFDRAEIRDVMAYLKLVVNPHDDIAAKRIINVPKRGIGKTSVERIETLAREHKVSFFEALELSLDQIDLGKKTLDAIVQFVQIINMAKHYAGDLREIVEMVVSKSGLIAALEAERSDEARGRIENIKEFFGVASEFAQTHTDEAYSEDTEVEDKKEIDGDDKSLQTSLADENSLTETNVFEADSMLVSFMEWLALRSDLDSIIAGEDYLTMMTIHSAKGLEFPVVFIAGLEESLFPHSASADNPEGLEEERRLAYVAITRARELLYITHAQARNLFGSTQVNPRSRFVSEIPAECLKMSGVGSAQFSGVGFEKRGDRRGQFGTGSHSERDTGRVFGGGLTSRSDKARAEQLHSEKLKAEREAQVFGVGDNVDHKTFGRGVVSLIEGDVLYVTFARSGETKKLLKGYAPIVRIG